MKLLVDLPDVQFTVGRPLRTSSQSVSRVLCCANGYDKHRKREQRCRSVGKYCKRTASTRQVQYIHAVLRNGLSNAERDEIINCKRCEARADPCTPRSTRDCQSAMSSASSSKHSDPT